MSSSNGIMNKVQEGMGNALDKFLSAPDALVDPEQHPVKNKVARIGFCILIMGIGATLFFLLNLNFPQLTLNLSSLSNPAFTTLALMAAGVGIAGFGGCRLIQEVLPKKYHREAGKLAAVVLPFFIAVGAACLVGCGIMKAGLLSSSAMCSYWFAGLLIFPLSMFAFAHSFDEYTRPTVHFVKVGSLPERLKIRNQMKRAAEKMEMISLASGTSSDTSSDSE